VDASPDEISAIMRESMERAKQLIERAKQMLDQEQRPAAAEQSGAN